MIPYDSGRCRLISRYGKRSNPTNQGMIETHYGIDLVGIDSDHGNKSKIVSVSNGIVVYSRITVDFDDPSWKMGNYVAVHGDDGVVIYYCHLQKRAVRAGQRVSAGDIIGYEGDTGLTYGRHLHLECRKGNIAINAAKYIGIENAKGEYDNDYIKVMRQKKEEETISNAIKKENRARRRNTVKSGVRVMILPKAVYQNGERIKAADRTGVYTVFRIRNGYALLKETWRWIAVEFLKVKHEKSKTVQ